MMDERLEDLIEEEMDSIHDTRLPEVEKRELALLNVIRGDLATAAAKRKGCLGRIIASVFAMLRRKRSAAEDDAWSKSERGVPEYVDVRIKSIAQTLLDHCAYAYVLDALYELEFGEPRESELPTSCEFPEYIIFSYLIKGKIRDIKRKLPDYERTLDEVSDDEALEDSPFSDLMESAYERLEDELSSISPPVRVDEPFKLNEKMDKKSLERYSAKLLAIRTQELLIEALTRIYRKYEMGFVL